VALGTDRTQQSRCEDKAEERARKEVWGKATKQANNENLTGICQCHNGNSLPSSITSSFPSLSLSLSSCRLRPLKFTLFPVFLSLTLFQLCVCLLSNSFATIRFACLLFFSALSGLGPCCCWACVLFLLVVLLWISPDSGVVLVVVLLLLCDRESKESEKEAKDYC